MSEERKLTVKGIPAFTPADNPKPFTKDYQPANKGKKPTAHLIKMMRVMGNAIAPQDLRNNAQVAAFLEENKMKGTVNEVLMAKLYSLALYKEDVRAFKLIFDVLQGRDSNRNQININFIAPSVEPDETEDLASDQFTLIQADPTPTP